MEEEEQHRCADSLLTFFTSPERTALGDSTASLHSAASPFPFITFGYYFNSVSFCGSGFCSASNHEESKAVKEGPELPLEELSI